MRARFGADGFGTQTLDHAKGDFEMATDWEERRRHGAASGQDRGHDRPRGDQDRDWMDRTGDELRSWLGDDEAERRRMQDERREAADRRRWAYEDHDDPRTRPSRSPFYAPVFPGGAMFGPYAPTGDRGDEFTRGHGPRGGWRDDDGDDGDRSAWARERERRRQAHDGGRFSEHRGEGGFLWSSGGAEGRRRGRGPKNYTRSDDRIREDVCDRLMQDPHVDASGIEVTSSGGEVALDGTVDERFMKRRAEDIAESVSGVTHVQNNLRLRAGQAAQGGRGV